jgi:DNA-binding CsgD family transcriptional regulator
MSQSAPVADIVHAIRAVGVDEPLFIRDDGRQLSRRELGAERLLTRHEIEILWHVSRNDPYGVIAHKLGIGVETVRKSTRTIRLKLAVANRADLTGMPVPYLPIRRKL